MRPIRRALLVTFVGVVALAAACSGGDNSFVPDVLREGGAAEGGGLDGGDARGMDSSIDAVDAAGIDSTVMIPDGATVLPDGAVVLPDGAVWMPDGGPRMCPPFADGRPACLVAEMCGNGLDDNCNGLVDEMCACVPGAPAVRCYNGCPAQAGIGVCTWGTMTCEGSGELGAYSGRGTGAGAPQDVICGAFRDFHCNGILDEGCSCRVGQVRPCYSGPAATRGVGLCHDGTQRCRSVGTSGATEWAACEGEQLPGPPACDGMDHQCNGMPYAGCSCTPGMTRTCYSGPAGTMGVGLCRAGMQSCLVTSGVAGWGPCVGETLPAPNRCDGIDRACNAMPDMGCTCTPGATRSCYTGPRGTEGVGACRAGMQSCMRDTSGVTSWGGCAGEVRPSPELCNGIDDDCDGVVDNGCACAPGSSRTCYDGPAGTEGVGLCRAGTQSCVSGTGGIGSAWGSCTGQTLPTSNRCDGVDRQCNGMPVSGCTCIAGTTRPCYDGPAGTAGVGLCRSGTQTCDASGTSWGACLGQTLPTPQVCDGLDHLCTGDPMSGCACTPGAMRSCYTGPAGTLGVGLCRSGSQTCARGPGGIGALWGACAGEVLPGTSVCDGVDRACNGTPYAGCICVPGTTRSCYDGSPGTAGVGVCRSGVQNCSDMGLGPTWGACTGQVLPSANTCDGIDRQCDGMPLAGCICTPGTMRVCYSGPAGTEGVGACRAGTQTCARGAGGIGSLWGACSGEVLPGPIVCDGIDHVCNGNYASDCPCTLGATRSCYSGPAGTAGVGTCRAGTTSCVPRAGGGTQWGTCSGEVLPAAPQCDGLDHACTGMLPNCNPTATCPAPITTVINTPVILTGMATAVPPATIASYAWAVIAQPAGSTYLFSSMTSNPTTFTAQNAGVYTIRLTVTDSLGRTSSCTVLVTATARSYLGTEFWAVTSLNSQLDMRFNFAIAIGNPNSSAVTVTVTGGALGAPLTFSVAANNTATQILPWVNTIANRGTSFPIPSSTTVNGAYRITATQPVSAYQFDPLEYQQMGMRFSNTNDASLLLPTVALTGNYLVLGHQSWYVTAGFVDIVGTSATPTTVTVTTRSPIAAGTGVPAAAAGSTQTYTVNRGDVIQLVGTAGYSPSCTSDPRCGMFPCANFCPYDPEDFTGTVITATAPVAVFSGADCTNISNPTTMTDPGGSCPACDHLEEQMFPTETWGREVVVTQFQDRGSFGTTEPYIVRIMSRENANTISFTPSSAHATVVLNRGQFTEFCTTSDFMVSSTQPILVGQYMVGQNQTTCGTCSTTAGSFPTDGDPSFTLDVPTPQYRRDYNFVVPNSYTVNMINVVGRTGAMILLDGVPLAGSGSVVSGTVWSVWRQAVTPGSHSMSTPGADGFGLEVLGNARYTSYAYPGGLDLRALP